MWNTFSFQDQRERIYTYTGGGISISLLYSLQKTRWMSISFIFRAQATNFSFFFSPIVSQLYRAQAKRGGTWWMAGFSTKEANGSCVCTILHMGSIASSVHEIEITSLLFPPRNPTLKLSKLDMALFLIIYTFHSNINITNTRLHNHIRDSDKDSNSYPTLQPPLPG